MTTSYSITEATTFTVTHARKIAAKVATDLKRIQRFYNSPSDTSISQFEAEAVELIKAGFLESVTYGFKKDGQWIEPTLKYTAKELSEAQALDDDPGKIRPGADVTGALFSSYLVYSSKWNLLSAEDQAAFEKTLPIQRSGSSEPSAKGYFQRDLTYSAGGRSIIRATMRSF